MISQIHPLELKRTWDYSGYKNLVEECARNNSTTGELLPERILATNLNAHRMRRIEKQVIICEDLSQLVKKVKSKWDWIVLAESWCGDGAQNIPVIAKVASLNPNIKLQITLRDENPELMNQYLTNGGRSIPKLICIGSVSGKEIGTWGPRPKRIAEMVLDFKTKHPNIPHSEFIQNLHLWYARDRGQSIQEDFLKLIFDWCR